MASLALLISSVMRISSVGCKFPSCGVQFFFDRLWVQIQIQRTRKAIFWYYFTHHLDQIVSTDMLEDNSSSQQHKHRGPALVWRALTVDEGKRGK